jgi:hypothetical protein
MGTQKLKASGVVGGEVASHDHSLGTGDDPARLAEKDRRRSWTAYFGQMAANAAVVFPGVGVYTPPEAITLTRIRVPFSNLAGTLNTGILTITAAKNAVVSTLVTVLSGTPPATAQYNVATSVATTLMTLTSTDKVNVSITNTVGTTVNDVALIVEYTVD